MIDPTVVAAAALVGGALLVALSYVETQTGFFVVWALIGLSIVLLFFDAFVTVEDPRLVAVDQVILIFFAIEWVLRVGSVHPESLRVFDEHRLQRVKTHAAARVRYAVRPMQLIDLLAILAVFPGLRALRALRLLRLPPPPPPPPTRPSGTARKA